MATWKQFTKAAPELSSRVLERFDAHTHKTIATLRKDGSPRISGTETQIRDGELWIGSMQRALKALDLQRDGRYALHSGSDDPPGWMGDAKVAGIAEEVTDPEVVSRLNGHGPAGPSHLFRLDVCEVSLVALNDKGDNIVIQMWTEADGIRNIVRD